jgi:hypothetical protein
MFSSHKGGDMDTEDRLDYQQQHDEDQQQQEMENENV